MNKTKWLLTLGVPVALMSTLVPGCASQQNQAATDAAMQVASNAPQGSTARTSEKKTGMTKVNPMDAATYTTELAFSSQPATIPVGKPVTWTLKVKDKKSGQPVRDFETEMTKKMHLIVVKNDLSWFNHIHPTLKANGDFVVTTTLPSDGSYKLYADYTPTGRTQEVPQHEFATGGKSSSPSSTRLSPDTLQGGWLKKKFESHPESEPETKGGATYEVALMPMPSPLKAGQDSMLHFQIRDAKGKPVKDLQPYLGAMGHCVILSNDTTKYLHSHPMAQGASHDMSNMDMSNMDMSNMDMSKMDMSKMSKAPAPKSGGPDVIFHTNFPKSGLYKVWGQFQHKGKIITSAFVVNVATGSAAATKNDEAKPHSH